MLPVNPDINRGNNNEFKTHVEHEKKVAELVGEANPYQEITYISIARYN
jgi:hypothetical protein